MEEDTDSESHPGGQGTKRKYDVIEIGSDGGEEGAGGETQDGDSRADEGDPIMKLEKDMNENMLSRQHGEPVRLPPHSEVPVILESFGGSLIDEWAGCKLIRTVDGMITILGPSGAHLAKSNLADSLKELFITINQDGILITQSLKEDRWVIVNILPRARQLYALNLLTPDANKSRDSKENLRQLFTVDTSIYNKAVLEGNEEKQREALSDLHHSTVSGVYVGQSIYMMGPVCARPPRPRSKDSTLEQVDYCNFKGSKFKREPGGHISGSRTLIHYQACSEINFTLLKALGARRPVGAVLSKGEKSLLQYCSEINDSITAMGRGGKITPMVAFKDPNPEAFDEMRRNLNAPYYPQIEPPATSDAESSRLQALTNRQVLCNGALLSRDHLLGPMGYVFKAPYMNALEYPKELISIFKNFAREFPFDMLSVRIILLAATVWVDDMSSPSRSREMCVDTSKGSDIWTVPEVRLAPFIIYFQHWLRWTEYTELTEYPHPFRFVAKALATDSGTVGLFVEERLLPERKVMDLMSKVRSKISFISPNSRKSLLPHMFPGSQMPRMINVEPYPFPGKAESALLGLPDVLHIGTPDYTPVVQDNSRSHIRLVIPKMVAAEVNTLEYEPFDLKAWPESVIRNLDHLSPTLICHPISQVGIHWEDVAEGFAQDNNQKPTPLSIDIRIHLSPVLQSAYYLRQYRTLKRLLTRGHLILNPTSTLRMGPDGFWGADGEPPFEETASREQSPVEPYVSAETLHPNAPLGPNYSHNNWDPSLNGQELETQNFRLTDQIIEILLTKHYNAHPVWTVLQEALERSNPGSWTQETLKTAITEANDKELKDREAFTASHAYCSMGGRPNAPYIEAVKTLIKALHHFCGLAVDEELFVEVDPEMDLNTRNAVTHRRVEALKITAESRDPSNARTIHSYVILVQLTAHTDHAPPNIYINMAEYYSSLRAMILERMLGERLLELMGL